MTPLEIAITALDDIMRLEEEYTAVYFRAERALLDIRREQALTVTIVPKAKAGA